jgi:hypothetical protein
MKTVSKGFVGTMALFAAMAVAGVAAAAGYGSSAATSGQWHNQGSGLNNNTGLTGQGMQSGVQTGYGRVQGGPIGTSQGFSQLDKNHNGYISKQEAQADPALARDWNNLNTHGSKGINQSDFSAFEANQGRGGQMPPNASGRSGINSGSSMSPSNGNGRHIGSGGNY